MYEQPVNYTLLQNCSGQTHLNSNKAEQNATVSSSSTECRVEQKSKVNNSTIERFPLLHNFKTDVRESCGQHVQTYSRQGGREYGSNSPFSNGIQANCSPTFALPLPRRPANNQQSYKPMVPYGDHTDTVESCQPHKKISCKLLNKDLWLKFKDKTTEMIITKPGRRMFPVLLYKLEGLQPQINYIVSLDMVLTSNMQWKFQNGQWTPSGQTDSHKPSDSDSHCHPDSPNSGAHFLKQEISFAKLKITNNKETAKHQIVLSSMHKYLPRLTVTPQYGLHEPQCFTFPETEFVAVTAYQNALVTQLKIDQNPFAKGFRDSGRAGGKLQHSPEHHAHLPLNKGEPSYYPQERSSYTVPEAFTTSHGHHFPSFQQQVPTTSIFQDSMAQYQSNGIHDYNLPLPAANAFPAEYHHQVSQPMQSYNGMHYGNWYPRPGVYQKHLPCPPPLSPLEPPERWSHDGEDVDHLQQRGNENENKQNWGQWMPGQAGEKFIANDDEMVQRLDQCRKRAHSYDLDNDVKSASCVKFYSEDRVCIDDVENVESEGESVEDTSSD